MQTSSMRVIGLMSGTSVDGIDAALVEICGATSDLDVRLIHSQTFAYPPELRHQILAVCDGKALSVAEFAQLDDAIALAFVHGVNVIQSAHGRADLIGSHGQTVYHLPPVSHHSCSNLSASDLAVGVFGGTSRPQKHQVSLARGTGARSEQAESLPALPLGYTVQLGRGSLIAAQTQCSTVSNFRVADIAMGGHGAPLVPPVDRYLLGHPTINRCVQNIGGIGNITYLPALENSGEIVRGWDTGPGNALLDLAVHHLSQGNKTYDQDGQWARKGTVNHPLVNQWLAHPFFHQDPPKSTGRELFGRAYLQQCLMDAHAHQLTSEDILATITELTVASIEHSYRTFLPDLPHQVLICGGGSHNTYLMERLRSRLAPMVVMTTDDVGLDADFKEAIVFAVLAYWRWRSIPGNLPVVTGALHPVPLGEIYLPPQLDEDRMKLLMEKIWLPQ